MRMADEMEMHIAFRSMRLAWVFTIVYLLIWTLYGFLKNGSWLPQFILLCSQNIVFWTNQIILKKNMVGKNEEQD